MSLLVTTTPTLEGQPIIRYLGVVSGEAILGVNVGKDIFASVRDLVGGRSTAYEQELQQAKALALAEMTAQAQAAGGNAIVGVDLDFETISQSMLMVCASGTAVVIQEAVPVPAPPSTPAELLAAHAAVIPAGS